MATDAFDDHIGAVVRQGRTAATSRTGSTGLRADELTVEVHAGSGVRRISVGADVELFVRGHVVNDDA
jgi:hypothetical protein